MKNLKIILALLGLFYLPANAQYQDLYNISIPIKDNNCVIESNDDYIITAHTDENPINGVYETAHFSVRSTATDLIISEFFVYAENTIKLFDFEIESTGNIVFSAVYGIDQLGLFRYDINGNYLGSGIYDAPSEGALIPYSLEIDEARGTAVVAGEIPDNLNYSDLMNGNFPSATTGFVLCAELQSLSNMLWFQEFGSASSSTPGHIRFSSVITTPTGYYVTGEESISGSSNINNREVASYMLEESSGSVIWNNNFDNNQNTHGTEALSLSDFGTILISLSEVDYHGMRLIILDESNGSILDGLTVRKMPGVGGFLPFTMKKLNNSSSSIIIGGQLHNAQNSGAEEMFYTTIEVFDDGFGSTIGDIKSLTTPFNPMNGYFEQNGCSVFHTPDMLAVNGDKVYVVSKSNVGNNGMILAMDYINLPATNCWVNNNHVIVNHIETLRNGLTPNSINLSSFDEELDASVEPFSRGLICGKTPSDTKGNSKHQSPILFDQNLKTTNVNLEVEVYNISGQALGKHNYREILNGKLDNILPAKTMLLIKMEDGSIEKIIR
jgi:hypothetical protein